MLRIDVSVILPLTEIRLVRKGPLEYLYPTLVENQVEFGFLHFQDVLVVEGQVLGIVQCDGRNLSRDDFVLKGGVFGELRVDVDVDKFEEDEGGRSGLTSVHLGPQLFQPALVPQNAYFRGLQILDVFADHISQSSLAVGPPHLLEKLIGNITIAFMMLALLIENKKKLVEVERFLGIDLRIQKKDILFEVVEIEVFCFEETYILTIHFRLLTESFISSFLSPPYLFICF